MQRIAAHIAVFTGCAIMLWSGIEDNDARAAAALGALSAASATLYLAGRQGLAWRGLSLKESTLSGLLLGALAALATTALMLFKNLRHAHIYPDYPAPMLLAMLERLPLWALAGALAGLGLGLLLRLRGPGQAHQNDYPL